MEKIAEIAGMLQGQVLVGVVVNKDLVSRNLTKEAVGKKIKVGIN